MSQQQKDTEEVWEQLVGDAFTPSQPLPPPPDFAGAVDEEMLARPSARLPLHVVPLSGPDSDAVPIEVAEPRIPSAASVAASARARAPGELVRPQADADATGAPQGEIADPIVAVKIGSRRRKLAPTLRTELDPPQDELDVVLVNVTQTGPHAKLPADEIVELDFGDLDIDESDPEGRQVLDVDLVEDDSTVAGEIDMKVPEAAPRGAGDAVRAKRSTAIANALRGATVRAQAVPERKVKTAIVSVSRSRAAAAKATTVRTEVVADKPAKPVTIKTTPPEAIPAAAMSGPHASDSASSMFASASSSASLPRIARAPRIGADVSASRSAKAWYWAPGVAALALVGIVAVAMSGGEDSGNSTAVAGSTVAAASQPAGSPIANDVVPTAAEEAAAAPAADESDAAPSDAVPTNAVAAPVVDAPVNDATRTAAGAAYVAAVERYETDHSNEAIEEMVLAACAMDDGPRARSAYRKLRGSDPRKRAMIRCRDRGIDVWARVDGPTASELLVVAQKHLDAREFVKALETARESNHVARSNGALLVMGIAHCRLGRPADAEELKRHLPPRVRSELDTLCKGS